MPATTVEFPDIDLMETLRGHISDTDCLRLGFMFDDAGGAQTISPAGFGYLVFAQACVGASAAETFAAGYQCAAQNHSVANDSDGDPRRPGSPGA